MDRVRDSSRDDGVGRGRVNGVITTLSRVSDKSIDRRSGTVGPVAVDRRSQIMNARSVPAVIRFASAIKINDLTRGVPEPGAGGGTRAT